MAVIVSDLSEALERQVEFTALSEPLKNMFRKISMDVAGDDAPAIARFKKAKDQYKQMRNSGPAFLYSVKDEENLQAEYLQGRGEIRDHLLNIVTSDSDLKEFFAVFANKKADLLRIRSRDKEEQIQLELYEQFMTDDRIRSLFNNSHAPDLNTIKMSIDAWFKHENELLYCRGVSLTDPGLISVENKVKGEYEQVLCINLF